MKVICTDNTGLEKELTLGQEYYILGEFDEYYELINDLNSNALSYHKYRFGKSNIEAITYEITYTQDGRSYITELNVDDIKTARIFKHEYEKLSHMSNVKIVKITKTQEEVE
jgi:hypothetical protein